MTKLTETGVARDPPVNPMLARSCLDGQGTDKSWFLLHEGQPATKHIKVRGSDLRSLEGWR